jgi:hypothetical protein
MKNIACVDAHRRVFCGDIHNQSTVLAKISRETPADSARSV